MAELSRRLRWGIAAAAVAAAAAGAQPGVGPFAGNEIGSATPAPAATGTPVVPSSEEARPLGGPVEAPGRNRTPAGAGAASPGFTRTIISLGGVLILIVGLGAAARFVARRHGGLGSALSGGGRSPAGVLEILGRYPVGRGATLVLLKLDQRVLLLSQAAGGRLGTGAGFSTLCEITDPEEVASILVKTRDAEGESTAERFRSLLSRFDRGMDAAAAEPGRRVATGPGGDRAELWDSSRSDIPVVDLTCGAARSGGAIGSLRRRLDALRGGTGA